jgi:S-DNA-T family DNA segregation ATPase FtsK/SpoIIIE
LDWPVVLNLGGAALIAGGGLSGLSLLFPEGRLTAPLELSLRQAFGLAAPLAALWLAVAGVLVLRRSDLEFIAAATPRLAGLLLFTAAAFPAAHMLAYGTSLGDARADGGGAAGRVLVSMLVEALGSTASLVLVFTLIVTGFMLAFKVPPRLVWLGVSGFWRLVARALRRAAGRPEPEAPVRSASIWTPSARLLEHLGRLLRRPAVQALTTTDKAIEPLAQVKSNQRRWTLPPLTLFRPGSGTDLSPVDLRQRARVIEETLASFNIEARVIEVNPGPAVTQFGLEPSPGVAVNRVLARANDLALRLGASPLRMEAPVPGKRVIGLEVPNAAVSTVTIRDLLESDEFKRINSRLRLALGRDVSGRPVIGDLARMPHLLIAGATGSGKSVCINTIIASLLVQSTPDELQFLMIDPKMVELASYQGIPHLRMPVVTDMDKVVGALKWAVREMERRYGLFAGRAARNLEVYNRGVVDHPTERPLPFLVIVIDELADMMMTAADEVERTLCRLAQLGRAAGIHLVVATQRPSVDVLTGLIKANFVTRIAFAVSAQVDSRVILDTSGAEKLLGRGDMLYLPADASKPIRLQGAYVSDQEIQDLVTFWQRLGAPGYAPEEVEQLSALGREDDDEDDELLRRAREVCDQYARVSVSLLQRRLGIGYPRAARLFDLLEERGFIGGSADTRPNEAGQPTSAGVE